jgi:uncharacterized membrane protein
LKTLLESCRTRRTTIEEAAKEQSVSVGEADLRRMKRQFSSLKNTFLHYEVKDEFIAALADGLPNGTEDIQLQQFEEEAERNISLLRDWKAKNIDKQEEIGRLIEEVDGLMAVVDEESHKTLQDMQQLFAEISDFEAFEKGNAIDIEPGMDEEECRRVIEKEAAKAAELEARLLASLEELKSLEGQAPNKRQDLEMLKGELEEIQESLDEVNQKKKDASNNSNSNHANIGDRHQYTRNKTSAWASESIQLLQSLSGVSRVEVVDTTLKIYNKIYFVTTPCSKSNEALTASNTGSVDQVLELEMDASTGHVIGVHVSPLPPRYTDEMVMNICIHELKTVHRDTTVEAVLGKIRSLLAGHYHRKAVVEQCGVNGVALKRVSPDYDQVTCDLGQGVEAELCFASSWPEGSDKIKIVRVHATSHDKADARLQSLKGEIYDSFTYAFQTIQKLYS